MALQLPELPYAKDALAPHISAETLEYHHGKHHNAYVTKLNELTGGDSSKSLEELVRTTEGGIFNQAAQVWNHTFYWHCMKPGGGGTPSARWAPPRRATGAGWRFHTSTRPAAGPGSC